MDCCNMAVSGDGCTYFHVCIQSVMRGVHVYKAVWTPVGLVRHPQRFSCGGEKAFDHLLGHLFNSKS